MTQAHYWTGHLVTKLVHQEQQVTGVIHPAVYSEGQVEKPHKDASSTHIRYLAFPRLVHR